MIKENKYRMAEDYQGKEDILSFFDGCFEELMINYG